MKAGIARVRDQRLIEGVIGAIGLFRGVPRLPLAELARQCWSLSVRRGEVVAPACERLSGVHAIAFGTVKLVLRQGTAEERVVRLVQAGQTFGEPSALLGRAPGYEARAVTESKVVVIPSAVVFALIDRDPRAARQVVATLAERSVELLAELESSGTRRGVRRLAAYLEGLAGDTTAMPCVVRLPASKTIIASRLDMTKETFSRLLRTLSDRGLIYVSRAEITLLDRPRLRQA